MPIFRRSPKKILEDRIKFWKSYGFKEPSFRDIYEENFKKENSGLITYDLLRKYSKSFDEVNYFAGSTTIEVVEDLIAMGKPEYGFILFLEEKPKEKNVTMPFVEEVLDKCLDSLEKKFGKRKAKKLREKFHI